LCVEIFTTLEKIMGHALTTYDVFADPGHAWMKVPLAELNRLGITNQVTSYSYRRGDAAYLEEDCDLSLFMDAKRSRNEGVQMRHHHTNNSSRIRSYARMGGMS
jgi:hypothetical protein